MKSQNLSITSCNSFLIKNLVLSFCTMRINKMKAISKHLTIYCIKRLDLNITFGSIKEISNMTQPNLDLSQIKLQWKKDKY